MGGSSAKHFDKTPRIWHEVPEVGVEQSHCKPCKGTGKRYIYPEWVSGLDADCGYCNGSGKVWDKKSIEVGGALFFNSHLFLLKNLPGVEIGVFHPTDVARFRFDGGDGLSTSLPRQ
ncbi:hypothetical protein GSUB_17630 (plasmid) [Geoalkalibacter subterraneus]|uniref:Uncharacterized protein n=2 Tax=Geoalkalibacter subterraneus TaxID=483547 RepID=A0A0B5FJF1_9BACT|nr:hypothetical protein GSUB_17630 [Geoalkalibacter subterraneus]